MPSKALKDTFFDWTAVFSKKTCLPMVCLLLFTRPWETPMRDSLGSTLSRVTETGLLLTSFFQMDFTLGIKEQLAVGDLYLKAKVNPLGPTQGKRTGLSLS